LQQLLGGFATTQIQALGGTETRPTGKAYVEQRNFAKEYLSIKVLHRKTIPVARLTPWGSRIIDYYEEVAGQKSRQLPIGGADMKEINLNWEILKGLVSTNATPCDLQLLSPSNSVISSVRFD